MCQHPDAVALVTSNLLILAAMSVLVPISGRLQITASPFTVVADVYPDIYPDIFPELPLPAKTLSTGLRQIVVTNPSR